MIKLKRPVPTWQGIVLLSQIIVNLQVDILEGAAKPPGFQRAVDLISEKNLAHSESNICNIKLTSSADNESMTCT